MLIAPYLVFPLAVPVLKKDVEPWAKVERLAALDRDAAAVNAGPNRLAARRAVSVAV